MGRCSKIISKIFGIIIGTFLCLYVTPIEIEQESLIPEENQTYCISGLQWFNYVAYTKTNPCILMEMAKMEGGRHYKNDGTLLTSNKGAVGLMGIMPINFEFCGGEHVVSDPIGNIKCGDKIFQFFYKKYSLETALKMYNGGYKYKNSKESINYARTIMRRLKDSPREECKLANIEDNMR